MLDPAKKPTVAIICGPTASGKSALALGLSRLLPATIINADASQVYADLPILSACPSPEERNSAPHRLFGTLDGAENCTAVRWAGLAKVAIAEAHKDGRLPVLVGGSGLYVRTLLDGIAPVPDIDPAIRTTVRALPVAEAYKALRREDPEAAARLAPTDSTRVARALEVVRSTGQRLADWHAHLQGGIGQDVRLVPLILTPPRDWLYDRCDQRFVQMLDEGAIAEVETLRARQLEPDLPVMRAIGVRDIIAMLEGQCSRAEAIAAGQLATRHYAKRQYTWFRNQPPADWQRIEAQLDNVQVNELAIKLREIVLTR